MRVTYRQLEAFLCFMETETVTAAAARMCVSQPAMSKILQGLELDLGLELFQRAKKRLLPTEDARLLYAETRRLFSSVANVERFAADLRNFRTGELRVVSAASIGHSVIAPLLAQLLIENPDLRATFDVSSAVAKDIQDLKVDMGFSVTRPVHPAVVATPIMQARAVCAVSQQHPLSARSEITPADLEGVEFISFMRDSRMRHEIDATFDRAGVNRRLRLEVQSSAEANGMVARGLGVAIVEPLGVCAWAGRGVVAVPYHPGIDFTFYLIERREQERSRLALYFLREFMGELARIGEGRSQILKGVRDLRLLEPARQILEAGRVAKRGAAA